ncbi:hypothetical protein ACFQ0Q_43060 [Streptomyces aureus]
MRCHALDEPLVPAGFGVRVRCGVVVLVEQDPVDVAPLQAGCETLAQQPEDGLETQAHGQAGSVYSVTVTTGGAPDAFDSGRVRGDGPFTPARR